MLFDQKLFDLTNRLVQNIQVDRFAFHGILQTGEQQDFHDSLA
jgi:hypothetical protein